MTCSSSKSVKNDASGMTYSSNEKCIFLQILASLKHKTRTIFIFHLLAKCTLVVLPKVPFKLTQSIHVALQKILTENCKNYLFFNTKTNKGEIGLYFVNDEKN